MGFWPVKELEPRPLVASLSTLPWPRSSKVWRNQRRPDTDAAPMLPLLPPSSPEAAVRAVVDDFGSAAEALRPDRSLRHPRLREVARFLENNRLGLATKLLQEFLKSHPRDVNALHLMAESLARQGRIGNAEALLAQCVELAPDFVAARFGYANTLLQANKPEAALNEAEELLKYEPQNPLFRSLKITALEAMENYSASAVLWRGLIADYPARPDCWVRYGHALRSMGRKEECIAAYRKVVELNPAFGGAWWSLADLKTYRFNEVEIEQMEIQLTHIDLSVVDRIQLLFSLGKAYADLNLHAKAFGNFVKANAIQRLGIKHDPDVLTAHVARCKKVFTSDLFRTRAGSGCCSGEPIFLVGMARSGSTLVEQILASHSQIEATRELADLAALATHLQSLVNAKAGDDYPGVLGKLDVASLTQLGERYLESTRAHRKLIRPFFIDKMGPNFVHIGFLQLILPNAKIVDVRRHPLACGLSNFAQLFPKGQNDAYRLTDIGSLYRNYVDLMAHFDRVLPGKVHRVSYESLVVEPEAEIRRLLDFLSLPFEHECLRFYRTDRVITTVSSEQVRSPIYRDSLEQWRHYERWLGPLIKSLGSVLTAYPSVPEELR